MNYLLKASRNSSLEIFVSFFLPHRLKAALAFSIFTSSSSSESESACISFISSNERNPSLFYEKLIIRLNSFILSTLVVHLTPICYTSGIFRSVIDEKIENYYKLSLSALSNFRSGDSRCIRSSGVKSPLFDISEINDYFKNFYQTIQQSKIQYAPWLEPSDLLINRTNSSLLTVPSLFIITSSPMSLLSLFPITAKISSQSIFPFPSFWNWKIKARDQRLWFRSVKLINDRLVKGRKLFMMTTHYSAEKIRNFLQLRPLEF